MVLPDYRGGSIVNLVSSIAGAMGGGPRLYEPLRRLPAVEVAEARNVVLLILDGLGYHYLTRHGRAGHLRRYLADRITSVFPSTTATAMTTFFTGLAPQEHGITGWFMHLKELGTVTAILPFRSRYGGIPYGHLNIDVRHILDRPAVFTGLGTPSYLVIPSYIANSDYSRAMSGSAERRSYEDLPGCFDEVRKLIDETPERKLICGYWPGFDGLCHERGVGSQEVAAHFEEIDTLFGAFAASLEGTDTLLIATADHGLIDTAPDKVVDMAQHAELAECLSLPLCGEPRTAYCYVRPGKTVQFERYVASHLEDRCTLHRSEDLIAQGYFGLYEAHPRLADRVGDYVLLMKENYVIKDRVLGESEFQQVGVHGGVSVNEMEVPLIVVRG